MMGAGQVAVPVRLSCHLNYHVHLLPSRKYPRRECFGQFDKHSDAEYKMYRLRQAGDPGSPLRYLVVITTERDGCDG